MVTGEILFFTNSEERRDHMTEIKDILETDSLILRPFTMEDLDVVHSWASNPDNVRYMSWGPNTKQQSMDFLTDTQAGADFAVVLKDTGALIGSCGIYPDGTCDTGEMGWILHQNYWKQGYGTELGEALIRYGFEDLKLRRISALCAALNIASRRIMEKNGMRLETLAKKAFWARVDKEWVDQAIYAILAKEYFAESSSLTGMSSFLTTTVQPEFTAQAVGSGGLKVLATPIMIMFMESACYQCLQSQLKDGQTSVGTAIEVSHVAPSPIGDEVTIRAQIVRVDERKVEFIVTANSGNTKIGEGKHSRVIVDAERFMAKLKK
jgi:predicted thioesterase/RimJ/RimL family protein N-acetyltransferase